MHETDTREVSARSRSAFIPTGGSAKHGIAKHFPICRVYIFVYIALLPALWLCHHLRRLSAKHIPVCACSSSPWKGIQGLAFPVEVHLVSVKYEVVGGRSLAMGLHDEHEDVSLELFWACTGRTHALEHMCLMLITR